MQEITVKRRMSQGPAEHNDTILESLTGKQKDFFKLQGKLR